MQHFLLKASLSGAYIVLHFMSQLWEQKESLPVCSKLNKELVAAA